MGSDSSFFVLFQEPSLTLDDAEKKLAYWKPARSGNGLSIKAGDTEIRIGLSDQPHVIDEAREIAEGADNAEIAKCPRRFECLIGDLEAALTDYTVLQGIQEDLHNLTKGFVFLTWNGNVLEM